MVVNDGAHGCQTVYHLHLHVIVSMYKQADILGGEGTAYPVACFFVLVDRSKSTCYSRRCRPHRSMLNEGSCITGRTDRDQYVHFPMVLRRSLKT